MTDKLIYIYVIFVILKWKFQKQAPVSLSKWIIKLFPYKQRHCAKRIMFRNSGTKISLSMKAVSNKMIYVRIIQRLLKKLVQLRQKIEKSPLRTNQPLLLLPHRSKINTTKFRVFVPSIFEHPSDSLNSWLITASPIV